MNTIALSTVLLFCLVSNPINGQQACMQNGSFNNACSTVVTLSGACPTWTDACGDGWTRSHGSPQMIYYDDGKNRGFYAFMWSVSNSNGEGMFTSYSFLAHHTYNVKIKISTSDSNGTVFIYAANGLTQSAFNSCGNPVPNISQKQLIGSYTGYTNGWIDLSFTGFIPNMGYSNIWIFPVGPSTAQYDLGVLYISACPSCDGVITYNNGVVPIDETMASTINVGSSAGTGGVPNVTIQANQTTALIGVSEVVMFPEFNAVVTSGSFSAKIVNCGSIPSGRYYLSADSTEIALPQNNESDQQGLGKSGTKNPQTSILNPNFPEVEIYPTISSGRIHIAGNAIYFNHFIRNITDQLGRQIFRTINSSENMRVLDLTHLSNGIYFIQIKNKSNFLITKKIIISK